MVSPESLWNSIVVIRPDPPIIRPGFHAFGIPVMFGDKGLDFLSVATGRCPLCTPTDHLNLL